MQTPHKIQDHALLSPSSASKWLNCTPSARIEEKLPEEETPYSREGTVAHSLADVLLRHELKLIDEHEATLQYQEIAAEKYFNAHMPQHCETYVNYCMELYSEAMGEDLDAQAFTEQLVHFGDFVDLVGYGTGDFAVYGGDTLDIVDLKYGKGVKVNAHGNPQLRLYALGFLVLFSDSMRRKIQRVRMHIVQPCLYHISIAEIGVNDLLAWAENKVKPKAKKAFNGVGVQVAGEWCQFCKAAGQCATLASFSTRKLDPEFRDPHLMQDKDLINIYSQIDIIELWIRKLKDHVYSTAVDGKNWPGMKLVKGSGRSFWNDEDGALSILQNEELMDIQDITNTKIKSISDIKAILGKENFIDVLGAYVSKKYGSLSLVPDSDPRPSIGTESAMSDFKAIEN